MSEQTLDDFDGWIWKDELASPGRRMSLREWNKDCAHFRKRMGETKAMLRQFIDPWVRDVDDAWFLYCLKVQSEIARLPDSEAQLRKWSAHLSYVWWIPLHLSFPRDFPGWLPGGVWDDELADVEDYLRRHEERLSEIRSALASFLTEREMEVLWRRYGYSGIVEKQSAIAADLGISQARVAQLEGTALRKIKEHLGTWMA